MPDQHTGATGLKTEAGKQRSRLNSYKHGLTGQIYLLTAEDGPPTVPKRSPRPPKTPPRPEIRRPNAKRRLRK